MSNPFDALVRSLDQDEPPPFATPMLRAIWGTALVWACPRCDRS